ncbi:MAG: patatin-like phospholipase family protein [Allorhizobium sp.]
MANNPIWLCLSGGNALGAFHAGACQQMMEVGAEPQAIAGASIGGIIGALFAGNAPEDRLRKLDAFFALAEQWSFLPETHGSKLAAGLNTLVNGRPGLFHPRLPTSLMTSPLLGWPFLASLGPSLFDTAPMRERLGELIDFDRLNNGAIRFMATAVDVETGLIDVFDSRHQRIGVEHLMATTAFPVLFPPVEIGGRCFVDPGLVANLPLDALFAEDAPGAVTCLALDTACPKGAAPKGLDAAILRAQDILFSGQSRQAFVRVEDRLRSSRDRGEDFGDSRVMSRAYCPEVGEEASLKMLDFRRDSMAKRWSAGRRAMADMLAEITASRDPEPEEAERPRPAIG